MSEVPVTIDVPVPLPAVRDGDTWVVEVDGVRVALSNLDKLYWEPEGYTKGDLLAYYHAVAPAILPYLRDRPLTMKRMPDGADGDFFYAKQAPAGTPSWVRTAAVVSEDTGKRIDYLVVDDTATLLHVANLGCIEMHPWHARADDLAHPDYAFFDLDPFDVGFGVVREVALLVHTVLEQVGLRGYPRTSGATGMQVYVPLDRVHTAAAVRDWVGRVCRLINRAAPSSTTMEWDISKRSGRVFLDHGMNTEGRNIASTWSVRPERGAPVATPLDWDEVAGDVEPRDFTITSVWEELAGRSEAFAPVLAGGQDLRAAMRAVGMDPDDQPAQGRHRVVSPGRGSSTAATPVDPATAVDEDAGELATYASMRDFSRTPEPGPREQQPARADAAAPHASSGRRFVVQHHLATRLHHDLRLERGGTARSWALPRGLPDVPGVRALAVQTEDHPLEYLTFSGEIPADEYGGGPVRIFDAGTYEPLEWTDDKVTFSLAGRRHRGTWHLFRPSDAEPRQWLVTRAGEPEELPPGPPALAPMLATDADEPFDDPAWLFEPKWDGVRAVATLERPRGGADGRTRLVSRAGNDVSDGYPEVAPLWERIVARNAVVDGELVALDGRGRPSFQRLQQRMHVRDGAALERLRRRIPVTFVVFDLLAVDGEALVDLPLVDRLGRLEDVLVPGGAWLRSRAVAGEGIALYEAAREQQLEGVVAKRAASPYQPGRRSRDWRKIKVRRRACVVVAGWLPVRNGSGELGSLVVGAWDERGRLVGVGRVGTGFDAAERARLRSLLEPLERSEPPLEAPPVEPGEDVRWVEPQLVAAVEYAELTDDMRLRAPSYQGIEAGVDTRTALVEDLRGASG